MNRVAKGTVIGTGIGDTLLPGAGGVLGGSIGGQIGAGFGFTKRASPKEDNSDFTQPTKGVGEPVRLPYGSNIEGGLNNPFGLGLGAGHYKGTGIWGGPRDLLRSLATRSMGINLAQQQLNRPDVPQGLNDALAGYANKNPYLASMYANFAPNIQTQGLMQGEENRMQMRELLQNAYILGGGLYGGQLSATASAKQIQKAKDAQKKALIQGIVGGAMEGLGMNQYGEKDTTTGLIGVI